MKKEFARKGIHKKLFTVCEKLTNKLVPVIKNWPCIVDHVQVVNDNANNICLCGLRYGITENSVAPATAKFMYTNRIYRTNVRALDCITIPETIENYSPVINS